MREKKGCLFYLFVLIGALGVGLCVVPAPVIGASQERRVEKRLEELRSDLDQAQKIWEESIDDPVSDQELKRSYYALQDMCRELYRRKGGFSTARQQQLCEITQYPYEIYHNELIIKVNNLRKQLFDIDTPGTVANDYYRWPSQGNLEKLKNIFEQVNKYYVGAPYTWSRYYNKYLFCRARLDRYLTMWENRLAEYKETLGDNVYGTARDVARRRAELAFAKLKAEAQQNNLPFCGKVGAFFLANNLDDYLAKEKEWEKIAGLRAKAGRKKEVVVFVHGLGEDRQDWRKFPVLLAQEDVDDPKLDRYFQVYVFRYDTVEDSKSVEGFRRELAGFIKDILKTENVPYVNLVGHSLGGVLSLKYIVQYVGEIMGEEVLPQNPSLRAKKLIAGYLDGKYRRPVARFAGIAPSLSGSEIANIMANIFKKDPPLYERSLAPFQSGIPLAGDLQVMENQLGSKVNINSFTRLDFERPLDPYYLLEFLTDQERSGYSAREVEELYQMNVKTLCLIGQHALVIPFFSGPEEDGLLKCYSANLNHIYMEDADAKTDVGYKSAQVRYIRRDHHDMINVEDRNHPSYGYVVSFLCDKLIPQQDVQAQNVRHFICMLRTYPDTISIDEYPDFCFHPQEKIYFSKDQRFQVPPLQIQTLEGGANSSNAGISKTSWNPFTGVFCVEGYQKDTDQPSWVSLRLSAPEFKSKVVHIPVSGGLVTYAVRLKLFSQEQEPPQ